MDKTYFIERMQASLAMAHRAAGSAARLIHLELAGRYSLAATTAEAVYPPPNCLGGASSFRAGAEMAY